jgi:hypothetical protein
MAISHSQNDAKKTEALCFCSVGPLYLGEADRCIIQGVQIVLQLGRR